MMTGKHDEAPMALTMPKEFRETVRIGSASSWDKNILSLFHVVLQKNTSNLREFIDSQYFEPPTDDEESRQGIVTE